ncbi:MAG TPA: cytochrome b/b6 domain-containing protein [Gemmatimonadales bacterium]|nr:cytochrome b/b6 domain-containing protein [Gemmatimonadales bacterium]
MAQRVERNLAHPEHPISAKAWYSRAVRRIDSVKAGWAGKTRVVALALFALTVCITPDAVGQDTRAEDRYCADCHEVDRLRISVHGPTIPCLSCHHEDRHRDFPQDSAVAARKRSAICADCHEDVHLSHRDVAEGAPLCTDCHSAHTDPPPAQAPGLLAGRCGSCHAQELADFEAGGHAASIALDSPNSDLPTCMTCHPPHPASAEGTGEARQAVTALCVDCHTSDLLIRRYDLPRLAAETYARDFHGTTLQFQWRHPSGKNQPDVMVCSDCHGAHKVGWLDRGQLAPICLDCHKGADERIVGAWLGHEPVGPRHNVAVWAVRVMYYVFIPLVLTGLLLHVIFDIRHGFVKLLRRETHRASSKVMVTRFSLVERLEHLLSMVTFTLLVLTGLPQSYPNSGVGNWFIQLWGGIGATRLIHRAAGVLFVTLLVLHVGRSVVGAFRKGHVPAMFPEKKDFVDAVQTLRHYLRNAPLPKVGKFDFREKFEYWGLFLGGTLMTVTGFVLLFPEGASQLLPGVVLAIARVMHGLEATFAVLVVVLWHSYGVILRPEVFPLDKSIFTGKISLERLREEHPLEYERIFGTTETEPDRQP